MLQRIDKNILIFLSKDTHIHALNYSKESKEHAKSRKTLIDFLEEKIGSLEEGEFERAIKRLKRKGEISSKKRGLYYITKKGRLNLRDAELTDVLDRRKKYKLAPEVDEILTTLQKKTEEDPEGREFGGYIDVEKGAKPERINIVKENKRQVFIFPIDTDYEISAHTHPDQVRREDKKVLAVPSAKDIGCFLDSTQQVELIYGTRGYACILEKTAKTVDKIRGKDWLDISADVGKWLNGDGWELSKTNVDAFILKYTSLLEEKYSVKMRIHKKKKDLFFDLEPV